MSSWTTRTRGNTTRAVARNNWSSPWAQLLALVLFMTGSASAQAQIWANAPENSTTTAEDTPFAYAAPIRVSNTPGVTPTVVPTSGNQTVVPNANVTFSAWVEAPAGTFTRFMTVSPAANRSTRRDNSNAPVTITLTLVGAADPTRQTQLTVTEVNDAPVANNDSLSAVDEDSGLRIIPTSALLANDNAGPLESGFQTISVTAVSNPVGGSVALNGSNVEFTPAANFNGAAGFTYQITDNGLDNVTPAPLSVSATVSFIVNSVNDAPVAGNDGFGSQEDVTLNLFCAPPRNTAPAPKGFLCILDNDTDADGDSLGAVLVSSVSSGILTLSPNGDFVYQPAANFNGADSFTYRATDGTLLSNIATVTITVQAVNDAPTAVADGYSTDEDQLLNVSAPGVLGNDTDVDGNPLTAALVDDVGNGSLTLNANGSFSYTPTGAFNGTDSFTYEANDGGLDSNTVTVTITVNAVNNAPTVVAPTDQTINEDTATNALAVTVADVDSAVNGLVVSATSSNQTLVPNANIALGGSGANRTILVTPAGNQNGSATITVTVSDGALTGTDTFVVNVTPVNDAPTAVADGYSTDEDQLLNVSAPGVLGNDTDVDGNPLTAALVDDVGNGSLTLNANGSFSYTPTGAFNGTDSFTYEANDGGLDSNTVTVTITVNAVNNAPTVVAPTDQTINEDTATNALAVTVADVDSAVNGLVVSATSSNQTLVPNANIALGGSGANRTILVTPAGNQNGSATITVTVSDGALTGTDTFVVNVTPVNDAPVFEVFPADIASVLEDSTTGPLTITLNDVENETIILIASTGNQALFPNANVALGGSGYNRTISFTTATDQNSVIVNPDFTEFNVTAIDAGGAQTTRTFRVDFVTAVNDAPQFTAGANQTVAEDAGAQSVPSWATAFQPGPNTATDESGQTLVQYTVTQIAGALTFATAPAVANNGTLSYTTALNANGSGTFEVRAVDSGNGTVPNVNTSTPRTLVINVTAVNDAPVAVNGSVTTPEDTAVAITASASDVDMDLLTYAIVAGPFNGTLTGTGPNRIYTPNADYSGVDSFTFTANDGQATSNVATFSITVTAVNDAPVAVADAFTTAEDIQISVNVLLNDTDVDVPVQTLSVLSFTQGSAGGVVAVDGPLLRYTPVLNFNGIETFTYIVTDGTTPSLPGTVTITVTAFNDAPVAVDDTYMVTEDTPLTVVAPGVLGNDTDVDTASNLRTAVLQTGPTSGTLTLNANGSFTYTPNADFTATDSFTYFVSDGALQSLTPATVTLTVSTVNDAPTISAIASLTVLEDQPTAALAFTVGDVETLPGVLVVTAASGNAALVPNANIVIGGSGASRTVTVTPVADANGGPVTITLTVTDADSATANTSFNLTIAPVNDAPGFTAGPNRSEAPGTGLRTVTNWATAISAGPANESSQTVNFEETEVTDPANVVTSVEVQANGTLQYVLTGASGVATINLQLRDNGGTMNGGIDVSAVQSFTITVAAGADLSALMTGSFNAIDGLVNYTITIGNSGPSAAIGARVVNAIPAGLTGYSWTCSPINGGVCPAAAGSGSIDFLVNLPATAAVVISTQGTYNALSPPNTIVNSVAVTAPIATPDNNLTNNTASVSLTIPLFADGFEGSAPNALDKAGNGEWSALEIDAAKLIGHTFDTHAVEAIRFARGDSSIVVYVRSIEGRTEARIVHRTGKALWQADGWIDASNGVVLNWLASPVADAVQAAELRSASR